MGGQRKIYRALGGGVYEKLCNLRGGSIKNKRQYLKGGLQNVNIGEGVYEIFLTVEGGSTKYSSKKGGGLGKNSNS